MFTLLLRCLLNNSVTQLILRGLGRNYVVVLFQAEEVGMGTGLALPVLRETANVDHLVLVGGLSEVLELVVHHNVLRVLVLASQSIRIYFTVRSLLVVVGVVSFLFSICLRKQVLLVV